MNYTHATKTVLVGAAALALAACVSDSIPNQVKQTTQPLSENNTLVLSSQLKLATWNVEHLAYPFNTGCKPRSQADMDAMRDYIEDVDADIYALQEVASQDAVNTLFPETHWQVFVSTRNDSEPYTCRGSDNVSTQQKVAYALRKGLIVDDVRSLSEFGLSRPSLRYGLQMNIQTEFGNITLLNVHMKSGCFVDNYSRSDTEACQVFSEQAPLLDQWIEEKEQQNIPYVVLGDFNHRLSAPYNHLTRQLFTNSDNSISSLHNTSASLIACHPYYPAPIDFVFLGKMESSSLVYKSQTHHFDNMQIESMLSDHCAVSLKISK